MASQSAVEGSVEVEYQASSGEFSASSLRQWKECPRRFYSLLAVSRYPGGVMAGFDYGRMAGSLAS
jgi:hypothetical protein